MSKILTNMTLRITDDCKKQETIITLTCVLEEHKSIKFALKVKGQD